jgi:hypothetical protein
MFKIDNFKRKRNTIGRVTERDEVTKVYSHLGYIKKPL